jgi:hypothetical protein
MNRRLKQRDVWRDLDGLTSFSHVVINALNILLERGGPSFGQSGKDLPTFDSPDHYHDAENRADLIVWFWT